MLIDAYKITYTTAYGVAELYTQDCQDTCEQLALLLNLDMSSTCKAGVQCKRHCLVGDMECQ